MKLFNRWNALDKCHICGCKSTEIEREYTCGDNVVCEYDVCCSDCGTVLNHWAYGYMQYPETRIESLRELWYFPFTNNLNKIKLSIKIILMIDERTKSG